MDDYKKIFEYWKNDPFFDEATRAELEELSDEKEIEDRFYKELEFGTAGLRGILGAGTNRMNKYVVRRATAGFAVYLLKKYGDAAKTRGFAIAYDCRNRSTEFALETALTMASYGIKAYLYSMISATPLLSYTVRELGCCGGVVVTASHNTKEYNGYKAYDETGCQLYPDDSDEVTAEIAKIAIDEVRPMSEYDALVKGLLVYVGEELQNRFLAAVEEQANPVDAKAKEAVRIIYTPLHGAGNVPVRKVLADQGYTNVSVVKEQEKPDGDFPTVVSPNPEEKSALTLAIAQAEREGADIVIATDPDSDRTGIAVWNGSEFVLFTGNQTGDIIVDYVLKRRKDRLTPKSAFVTTVVTGELAAVIAQSYGVQVDKTLTGFKFIGSVMNSYDRSGEKEFVVGFEESYGYLAGTHARDKDAVVTSMIIAEMAAYYKAQGKTLCDVLAELYKKHGNYLDVMNSYVFKGKDGAEKILRITAKLRELGSSLMPGIVKVEDYAPGLYGLAKSNVLKFYFGDGSWVAARPSGTEPKIKFYFCIRGEDADASQASYLERKARLEEIINEA